MSDQREYQLAHKAAGLCTQCRNDAYLGGTLCKACRDRQVLRMRNRRNYHHWREGHRGNTPLEHRHV